MVRKGCFLGIAAAALLLGGCADTGNSLADVDNELIGANQSDPALTAALEDQILVDPSLTQQSNRDAARPSSEPGRAPIPPERADADSARLAQAEAAKGGKLLSAPAPSRTATVRGSGDSAAPVTLGELAKQQAKAPGGASSKCGGNASVEYDMGWASRLPAAFPVYPRAAVSEAAAINGPGCAVRIVSFASDAPMQALLDYYYTQAVRGGYGADHELHGADHILAGVRARDDAAYYIILTDRPGGGTNVDLIANHGR